MRFPSLRGFARRPGVIFGLVVATAVGLRGQIVANGSFELGAFVPDSHHAMALNAGSTAITGWTTFNSQLAWIDNANDFATAASHGSKFLDLSGYDDSAPYGGVQQTITTTIGQPYLMQFDLGTNPIYGATLNVTASAGATAQTFTFTTGVSGYGTYQLNFTASAASTLISFVGVDPSGNGIGLDNVSVTAIPEPSAWAMLVGCGALAIAGWRRLRG
jgi:hypothetical protein